MNALPTPLHVLLVSYNSYLTSKLRVSLLQMEKKIKLKFRMYEAHSQESAIHILHKLSTSDLLDLVLFTVSLSGVLQEQLRATEVVGQAIRHRSPRTRITVLIDQSNSYLIWSILQSIHPDGLAIHEDLVSGELYYVVRQVLLRPPYFSPKVNYCIQNLLSSPRRLEKLDLRILYELTQRTTITEMAHLFHLSRSAIKKRKSRLKELLEVPGARDRELLIQARKKGLI